MDTKTEIEIAKETKEPKNEHVVWFIALVLRDALPWMKDLNPLVLGYLYPLANYPGFTRQLNHEDFVVLGQRILIPYLDRLTRKFAKTEHNAYEKKRNDVSKLEDESKEQRRTLSGVMGLKSLELIGLQEANVRIKEAKKRDLPADALRECHFPEILKVESVVSDTHHGDDRIFEFKGENLKHRNPKRHPTSPGEYIIYNKFLKKNCSTILTDGCRKTTEEEKNRLYYEHIAHMTGEKQCGNHMRELLQDAKLKEDYISRCRYIKTFDGTEVHDTSLLERYIEHLQGLVVDATRKWYSFKKDALNTTPRRRNIKMTRYEELMRVAFPNESEENLLPLNLVASIDPRLQAIVETFKRILIQIIEKPSDCHEDDIATLHNAL